jgi:hypothetical protein
MSKATPLGVAFLFWSKGMRRFALFVGLLVCWFVGLLVCWFVGLLVCWFVGLLVCWANQRKVPARGEGPPHSLRVKDIKRLRERALLNPTSQLASTPTNRVRAMRVLPYHFVEYPTNTAPTNALGIWARLLKSGVAPRRKSRKKLL